MTIEQLLTTHFPDDPVSDAALATALLRRTAREPNAPALVRIYSPAPTLSFGRLDAVRPQFPVAAEVARQHGFTPLVRGAGGRAAAYHEQTLVVEIFSRDSEGMLGARPRFQRITPRLVAVLRKLGVDARIGPVPGEYCPGEWTVNGAGRVKLAGTAQRIVAGAWLFGFELVVSDSAPVRAVLTDVNAALDLEFDPGTAASLTDLNPSLSLGQVRAAILAEIGVVHERTADPDVLAEAANLRDAHVA
ncbi:MULTISPECIES: lipoate--protein ligase family protein [unclassified Rhodococcus (in: high G+C Gram-positive bacteria)]|uniref:lipoate--protein ligase family protein n=1 Tax=unclassified Rhodococcus (in: high G+C Gram-positive bacteria) TaxID=192944 RepID=UPI001639FF6C|nr:MULTISPECIES: lipoate--protein ligase family protein [unclassified Rhodococcus (in: high G+C Gram-positive bacteria)]MBC2638288.1 lipoate--protein ligase family protein [Rhodococcus sp. 3A]MBC2896971.1 lipoate--protein ligase family protein [Rhodococcus sp. 4CII]